jgi:Glycosyltransferase family 87
MTMRSPVRDGLTLAGAIVGLYYVAILGAGGKPWDALAYWIAPLGSPYARHEVWGSGLAFMYSPAFRQAIEPLMTLGWPAFIVGIRLASLAALVYLAGPWTLAVLFLPPVASELNAGNINLLIALTIVLGIRHPAAWSFVLLTKVTPGVGLLWFAVRREWRSLGIAVGATVAIASASFLLAPSAWLEWVGTLARAATADTLFGYVVVPLPLVVRLAIAAVLAAWAAYTGRPARLLLAAWIAFPSTWYLTVAVLVGARRLGPIAPAPRLPNILGWRPFAHVVAPAA